MFFYYAHYRLKKEKDVVNVTTVNSMTVGIAHFAKISLNLWDQMFKSNVAFKGSVIKWFKSMRWPKYQVDYHFLYRMI